MPRISESLPVVYQGLFPSFFEREVPVESKATCSSCAMCEGASAVEPIDGVSRLFRPDTKCCTYYPRLPNYLVGALLADENPALAEGRRRVRARIGTKVGVLPQWLRPPAKYNLLYENARWAFGKASSLRCPYYDEEHGNCTVWLYREAVCSTFFCKYVAGADGRKFWMSLKGYLALAEIQLSRYAILQLQPDYVLTGKDRSHLTQQPLTAEDLDERAPSEKEYASLWREWAGREEEFYKRSFGLVRALSAAEFDKLIGLDGVIYQQIMEKHYGEAATPQLPKLLKLNPNATVKWLPDGGVALGSYSEYDAVALPGEAYELLTAFTGREPVDGVRERLRSEKQADLAEDVLLVLYQHRILTEPA